MDSETSPAELQLETASAAIVQSHHESEQETLTESLASNSNSASNKRKSSTETDETDLELKRNRRQIDAIPIELPVVEQDAQKSPEAVAMNESQSESEPELSDCSHHTPILEGGHESDSSSNSDVSGMFDWNIAGKRKQKKQKQNKTVTSNSRHDVPSPVLEVSDKSTRRTFSTFNTTRSKPTFCVHPVIVQDKNISAARLSSLKWKLPDTLQLAVGAVKSVKQISSDKFLIGCCDIRQQLRLAALTTLGGIQVSCSVPVPVTVGVASGIPTNVTMEEVLQRVDSVLDSEGHALCLVSVKDAVRLTNRDGSPSLAVRLTFEATTLPAAVVINKTEFPLKPFSAGVVRCFKCQRLGHLAKACPAKLIVCSSCGVTGHNAKNCTSHKRYCINCRSDSHSSAYGGCPKQKQWLIANRLRAETYMPKATAFAKAKSLLAEKQARHASEQSSDISPPNSAWKSESSPTYASITASHHKSTLSAPMRSNTNPTTLSNRVRPQSVPKSLPTELTVEPHKTKSPSSVRLPDEYPSTSALSSSVPQPELVSVNSVLKAENEALRKQVAALEEKISNMSKSINDLSHKLSSHSDVKPKPQSSACENLLSSSENEVSPLLVKAIESAIIRLLPTLLASQLRPNPSFTYLS